MGVRGGWVAVACSGSNGNTARDAGAGRLAEKVADAAADIRILADAALTVARRRARSACRHSRSARWPERPTPSRRIRPVSTG